MTRLFENHLRLGSMRALGLSRLWKEAACVMLPSALRVGPLSLRTLSCLTFFAVR